MFLLPEIERKSLHPWEPVKVAWWLYVSEDFDARNAPGTWRFEIVSDLQEVSPEFFAEIVEKADSLAGGRPESIRGNGYRVAKVAEAVLVPRRSGEVQLPGVSVAFFGGPAAGPDALPALSIDSPRPALPIPPGGQAR
jgi:hypothetical protein